MPVIDLITGLERNSVEFTPEKRERLREAYKTAQEGGDDVFTFEDNEYVTNYAKYLIEYLDMKLVTTH